MMSTVSASSWPAMTAAPSTPYYVCVGACIQHGQIAAWQRVSLMGLGISGAQLRMLYCTGRNGKSNSTWKDLQC